jgi:hypothetical protein
MAAAPVGVSSSSSDRAWLTTTSLLIPPGVSSATKACGRQHSLFRQRARSVWCLTNSRHTAVWSAARTGASDGARNAATATERASLGSVLVDWPEASTRTREANVAGTSRTVSPAATSCWASR